jgi:5-methylcytosine-specific restriction endonuclease McrA
MGDHTPEKLCAGCSEQMPPNKRPHAVYCTRKCKAAAAERRRPRRDNAARYVQEHARRKQYAIDRYWENPDDSREYSREWRKANPEKRKLQHQRRKALMLSKSTAPFTLDQWKQKQEYWGNTCYLGLEGCTGGPETMDHVKPITATGSAHILANLRPACLNCNNRKNAKWPFPIPNYPNVA